MAEIHIIEELICINCKYRLLYLNSSNLWLKQLECSKCRETGYIISTGELISDEIYEKIRKENPELKLYRVNTMIESDKNM